MPWHLFPDALSLYVYIYLFSDALYIKYTYTYIYICISEKAIYYLGSRRSLHFDMECIITHDPLISNNISRFDDKFRLVPRKGRL